MNLLQRTRETERMKRTNWMNDLTWMNWNKLIKTNDLKRMNCQNCPEPLPFFTFFLWNRSLVTVSCTCCRRHLPKVVRTRQFIAMLIYRKSSPRHSLGCILSTTFSDRGGQPRKHRPSSGDHGRPLYPKNQGCGLLPSTYPNTFGTHKQLPRQRHGDMTQLPRQRAVA